MKKILIPSNKKNVGLLMMLLVFVATIITYSNHFSNTFHFDDTHSVVDNPFIRNIGNIPLFFKDGSTASVLPQNQAYRPVVVTSLAFDYWVGNGYNLFWFHFSTFIFFLLQGLLMYFLYTAILQKVINGNAVVYIPVIASALYLLHPAIAETINYIIARSDVLSTFFVVLALVMYIYSPFSRRSFLYLLPVIIGALAKPSSVVFAPILFFYILLFEARLSIYDLFKKSNLPATWSVARQTIPAFVVCICMYFFIAEMTPQNWEPGGTSPIQYLITQPYVILYYFATFFAPVHLSSDSDWTLLPGIWDARFFSGLLFIVLMLVAMVFTSSKAILRPVSFGIGWFFLALVPSSSIIPLGEVLNDHRLYFPYIGLSLSVCWTVYLLGKKYFLWINSLAKNTSIVLLLLILSAFAYGTYQRNKVWHTEESLWYDVTIKSPKNGRGLMNYGLTQMAKGNYAEAENNFLKALALVPNYALLHVNLGVLKEATGDKANAESYFLKGINSGPNYPDTYYFYGRFLYNNKRYAEAIPMLSKAIELSPSFLLPREMLMKIYQSTEEWDRLAQMAQSTLAIVPGNATALQYAQAAIERKSMLQLQAEAAQQAPSAEKYLELSLSYYNAGKYEQCIEAAKEALRLRPGFAEAYNNIGSAYNALKQFDKAIEPLRRAVAINPASELAKNNLAFAEASANELASALQAIKSAPTAENYINLSLAYFNKKMYQQCIEACDKALAIKPDYDLAYNNKCAAYNELKQWDKAIAVGKKGIAINPANEILKNNLQVAVKEKEKMQQR